MKGLLLPLGSLAIAVAACNNNDSTTATPDDAGVAALSADSLSANIEVLASDAFMGRRPFTEGETKTVEFLTAKYAAAGLERGNGNSYIQEVPMVSITTRAAPSMKVSSAKGDFELKGFEDYVMWTD